MAQDEAFRLQNQLCFPIYLASKEITGKYTQLLKQYDLTYTQYVVMMYFWNVGSSNLKEVSRTLMLDCSTLSPLIKKLEDKGFLERKRSQQDERNLLISPTQRGLELKERTLGVTDEVKTFFDLSAEEIESLKSIVLKLLKKSLEKDDKTDV